MILKYFLTITLFVAFCKCYHTQQQQVGGIKSYGGYVPATGQNDAASEFVNSQNYQQPAVTSYQPYGWNFNQPARTYGGVNVLQRHDQLHHQNANRGQMGWTNNNFNNMQNINPYNNFPFFPPIPQFNFPQFPFPNFNYYPNNYQPNYQPGNVPYPQYPMQNSPNFPMPMPVTQRPTTDYLPPDNTHQTVLPIRPEATTESIYPFIPENTQTSTINNQANQGKPNNNNGFSTNNFFENTDDRQWTIDQEQKWQATTKKPFFENTVPGSGCTLPAASIIGAKDVFSAVELLPLSVPFGKPILSCNATGLKQTHVKIKNRIYSCRDGIIQIECRGNNGNNCPGNVLMCDIRSAKPLTCTNGTMVSNRDLECATIQIGNPQSILNCGFKDEDIDVRFQEASTTIRSPSVEKTTTRAPIRPPTKRPSTPEPFNVDADDQEIQETINRVETENFLMPEVRKAMTNIFPHNLLLKPSRRLLPPNEYLPPFESQASRDVAQSIRGIFPMELLLMSKYTKDESKGISTTSEHGTRLSGVSSNQQSNNNDDEIGFKTQLGIDTRFSGNTQQPVYQQQDFRDRLIFSN